jgi:hypothetical protein
MSLANSLTRFNVLPAHAGMEPTNTPFCELGNSDLLFIMAFAVVIERDGVVHTGGKAELRNSKTQKKKLLRIDCPH